MNQLESILSGGVGLNPGGPFVDGRRQVLNQSVTTDFKESPVQIEIKEGQFQMHEGKRKAFTASVKDTQFEKCTFSNVEFEKMLFQNCVFSQCKFEECYFLGSNLEHCLFEGTKFIEPHFGTSGWIWKTKTILSFCTFRKCKFKHVTSAWPEYQDCLFDDCDLRKVSFNTSRFERCNFNTLLDETEFYGRNPRINNKNENTLKGCDFRGSTIKDVAFFYLDLDPKYLPKDENLLVIPRGPEDILEWKKRISYSGNYMDEVAKTMGRPSVEYRAGLEEIFSPEQMQVLYEIIGDPQFEQGKCP